MEEWKDILGFPYYQVSNIGRVRSLKRNKETILKPASDGHYLGVNLYSCGHPRTTKIHRLVAEAFIPNPENKNYVDHINHNKTDNTVENLRWVTNSENMHNAIRRQTNTGEKYISKHPHCNSYAVSLNKDGKHLQKNFKTLEKAIAWRNENLWFIQ